MDVAQFFPQRGVLFRENLHLYKVLLDWVLCNFDGRMLEVSVCTFKVHTRGPHDWKLYESVHVHGK